MFLKISIAIEAVALIGLIAISWKIAPHYAEITAKAVTRSGVLFRFLAPSAFMPLVTVLASLVYAFAGGALLFYFFEKTPSPELRFLSIFIFSFVFEAMRSIVPLQHAFNLPGFYLNIAARALFFGRLFGIFSLFAASLCVTGFKKIKEENILLPIVVIALLITYRMPISDLLWSTSLSFLTGYTGMFASLEFVIILISIASFCVGAYTRNSREYYFIGAGVFLVFIGKKILIAADVWPTAALGFICLVAGTWLCGLQIRRMYLWL
jgi:hypothetical protein